MMQLQEIKEHVIQKRIKDNINLYQKHSKWRLLEFNY